MAEVGCRCQTHLAGRIQLCTINKAEEDLAMGTCHTCGNQYDDTLQIEFHGKRYEFDCFECAIHALAPECYHCDTRVIGHGVQVGEKMFCCAHCARMDGNYSVTDRGHDMHAF